MGAHYIIFKWINGEFHALAIFILKCFLKKIICSLVCRTREITKKKQQRKECVPTTLGMIMTQPKITFFCLLFTFIITHIILTHCALILKFLDIVLVSVSTKLNLSKSNMRLNSKVTGCTWHPQKAEECMYSVLRNNKVKLNNFLNNTNLIFI